VSLRRGIPSLTALQAFEAAARHQSFSKAAEELHQTHGAVSKKVNELEASLGVALFQRVNQRVVLTRAGAEYAHRIRIDLEQIRQDTQQLIASQEGETLRVAVGVTFGSQWLVPRLSRFHDRYPDIRVRLAGRDQATYFDDLNFDIAIHFDLVPLPGLASTVLLDDDEVWMIASPALCERCAEAGIAAMSWIHTRDLPEAWSAWRDAVAQAPDDAGRSETGDHHFDFFIMAVRAAVAGLGVALLPRVLIEQELAAGQLVRIGDYAVVNAQKAFLMFPEQKRDWSPRMAFASWIMDEMAYGRRAAGQPAGPAHR